MAEKGWTAQVATAAGMAAGIGAAQLGLGYGLGVVVWPAIPTVDDSVWLGSLGWATWIAASSTVLGAVAASRLGRPGEQWRARLVTRPPTAPPAASFVSPGAAPAARQQRGSAPAGDSGRPGGPWRFALATAAAIGALLAVALIAIPARSAVRADTFSPQTIAGGYALLGVLLGLAIAYWAVVSRPVAANLIATATWLWALAATAIVVELTTHRASATYLTSWQFTDPDNTTRYGILSWPSSLLTLLAALVIGAVAALPAVRRGDLGIGAATSGAVGPLLVAAAFFVLAPRLTSALGALESAYLVAPYAVLTGLAGSAMMIAIGQRAAERDRRPKPARRSRPAKTTRKAVKKTSDSNGTATGIASVPAGNPVGVSPPTTSPETTSPETTSPETTSADNGAGTEDQPTTGIPRTRPRVKGRLRRRGGDPAADEPAVPTGRAKAPPNSQPSPAPPDKSPSAAGSPGGNAEAGSPAPGRSGNGPQPPARPSPVPMQAPPSAPAPMQPAPKAPEPISAPKPPAAPAPRPAPANAEVRSTVAPPPTDPPIAKINPSTAGVRKPPTRPSNTPAAEPSAVIPPGAQSKAIAARPSAVIPPSAQSKSIAAEPSPVIPPGAQSKSTAAQPSAVIPPGAQSKAIAAQPSPVIPPGAQSKATAAQPSPVIPPGAQSKGEPAAKSTPAKRAPAKRTTAKSTTARNAKSAPTDNATAKADPKSGDTAASAEASPLWVEDSEAPPPKKRRFGRRSNDEG